MWVKLKIHIHIYTGTEVCYYLYRVTVEVHNTVEAFRTFIGSFWR